MWGGLLAASIAGWLHQLTATAGPAGQLFGHGVRGGQAMIATRGYSAAETKETLSRSRLLINHSTGSAQKVSILYGLWACAYVGGALVEQKAAATELMAEAEQHVGTR